MARATPVVLGALLLASGLAAQVRFDPNSEHGREAVSAFEKFVSSKSNQPLMCSVMPFPPTLSYDLRVWTGYQFFFPAWQLEAGKPALLLNVFRVTPVKPKPGEPVWFHRHWNLPAFSPEALKNRKVELEAGGGFLVGSGEFQVDWLLVDDRDRICRKTWKFNSNPPLREQLGLTPGLVDDDSRVSAWPGPKAAAGAPGKRATILVNVYPTFRRRYLSRLSWWDRRLLTTAITTTVDRAGFASARVVLFDLERRRVLFEDNEFGPAGYRRLLGRLGEADFATIDYSVLREGQTEFEFLRSLIETEGSQQRVSDAVVFVTPAWREGQRKSRLPDALWEAVPRLFCIALSPRNNWVAGSVVDFVKAGKGQILSVFAPQDLARATEKIQRELRENRP